MTIVTTRRLAVLAALATAVLFAGGAALAAGSRNAAGSGPEWLPFKGKYKNAIGCTWNNGCQSPTAGYHGYPAIDFMVPRGTPIYAAGPGTVEVAYLACPEASRCGPNGSGFGNAVAVRHDNGQYSWYAHLTEVYVGEGAPVVTGQLIAKSGATGNTTGPHLHYEERPSLWEPPVYPGSMFAFHGDKKVSYPDVLGPSRWDALPCGRQSGEPGCNASHTIRSDGYSLAEATGVAPPVDIEIAIDTSSSMVPSIARAQSDASSLIAGVVNRYPGVRFAVAQFRDHVDDLIEYKVEQAFTSDPGLAQSAIGRLTVAGGGDHPEAYNLVFNRSRDPRIGWRPGSRRLLVVIGDAEPHGAGAAGISGCRDFSPDPRGFNTANELAQLRKARVTLLMILQSSPQTSASLDCYRSLAAGAYPGGGAFEGGAGNDVAAAINRLIDKAIVTYVAVGDSFSSGEGNAPFAKKAADCHRSAAAWPNVLASQATRITFLGNLACSGATKDALDKPFKGQRPMIDQVADLDPDLVTLTITGNDVGFGSVIGNCFVADCVSNGRLGKAFNAMQAQEKHLPDYLRKLKKAAPHAKIVLIGYPKIFPRTQAEAVNCGWLEPEERAGLNTLGDDLNEFERRAAASANVRFVSVLDVLAGHELCTRDSWMYKIVPKCVKLDSRCGHPLKSGQNAIANKVRKALGL